MNWKDIKKQGNPRYKGQIEPIDLIKEGGMLRNFALGNIIKYAYRSRSGYRNQRVDDMFKIIHYAKMIITCEEREMKNEIKREESINKV